MAKSKRFKLVKNVNNLKMFDPHNYSRVWIDGACGPKNPGGHMGWGVKVVIDGKVHEFSGHVEKNEKNSCNLAEYLALTNFLKELPNLCGPRSISILSDSKLLISQMLGKWRIKQGSYAKEALDACRLVTERLIDGYNFRFTWIPREQNLDADRLSKNYLFGKRDVSPQQISNPAALFA